MKRQIAFCFSLIFLFAAISCKKNYHTHINGTVYENGGQQIGVANARVQLISQNGDQSQAGSNGSLVAETTTDANGNFTFDFDGDGTYIVYARANGYKDNGGQFKMVTAGKTNDLRIPLSVYTWLKLRLINAHPVGTNDWVGVNAFTTGEISLNAWEHKDKTFVGEVIGNGNLKVILWIDRNFVRSQVIREVYCPARDTAELTIEY